MGALGQHEVEPRIIDQHHCVGTFDAKAAFCVIRQAKEGGEVSDDSTEAHDGQFRQWKEQSGSGRDHRWAAETYDFRRWA
jgi:hypothetical protein